jgi:FAD/FMN-containing dehydrogenase
MGTSTVGQPATGISVESLRESVRGQLLTAGDEGYDQARAVHNGMFDKHPLAVLRAEQVADVIAAVHFARDKGLDLAIRDGGHSAPGFGTSDGGLVIDMSPMHSVHVDPGNKTARADAGATWGDFNHATHAFGLATTGGIISTTGVTGLTLGGGIGYLARGCGLSIDNLISADVVTAEGKFVTASADENEDLFWGLRGGGGNFGVVTSLAFRLHEVDQVFAGPIFYNLEDAASLLSMFDEFIQDAPEQFGGFPGFQIAPPLPFIPEDRHGDTLALAVVHWAGPARAGPEGPSALLGCGPGRGQRDRAAALPGAQRGVRPPLPQGHPRLLEGRLPQRAARRGHRRTPRARIPGSRGERHHAYVPDQRGVPPRRAHRHRLCLP